MSDCKILYLFFVVTVLLQRYLLQMFSFSLCIYSTFTQPNALLNCCSLLPKCKWQNKTLAAADRLISNGKKESEMQTNIISCQCCCKHFSKILFIRASNRIFAYVLLYFAKFSPFNSTNFGYISAKQGQNITKITHILDHTYFGEYHKDHTYNFNYFPSV